MTRPGDIETRPTLLVKLRDLENAPAWEEFATLYTPLVYRFCLSRGLQASDASDVTQEVMKTCSRHLPVFDYQPKKGRFRDWLFRVIRSRLTDFWRRSARYPDSVEQDHLERIPDDRPDPLSQAWDQEFQQHLLRRATSAVKNEFNETTWQAFWRTAVDEEDPSTVGDSLDLTRSAVYVARSRVLARIRERCSEWGWEDDRA